MRDFCSREKGGNNVIVANTYTEQVEVFKVKFLSDAKANARGESDSEIKIFDIFEENHTAYYVYIGSEEVIIEEKKPKEEVVVEETKVADINVEDRDIDTTAIDVNVESIEVIDAPKKKEGGSLGRSLWEKHKKTLFICLFLAVAGLVCASIALFVQGYSTDASDELAALEDTVVVDEKEMVVDTLVYDNDMQGEDQGDTSQQEFEKNISLADEWLEISKKNLHKPSNVQNILNARYYYYDKASSINLAMKGERLPAHTEINDVTEQEYQYWVNEAKKLGADKRKFELKRTYLQRARALSFMHQHRLDAQIKWLDDQLAKKNRKRRR